MESVSCTCSKLGLKTTTSLYKIAMCLADVVIPQVNRETCINAIALQCTELYIHTYVYIYIVDQMCMHNFMLVQLCPCSVKNQM